MCVLRYELLPKRPIVPVNLHILLSRHDNVCKRVAPYRSKELSLHRSHLANIVYTVDLAEHRKQGPVRSER